MYFMALNDLLLAAFVAGKTRINFSTDMTALNSDLTAGEAL